MISLDGTILVQMINFLVLMFILDKIFFTPLIKTIAERRDYVDGLQKKIAERLDTIQTLQADYQTQLDAARERCNTALRDRVQAAESEKRQLVEAVYAETQEQVRQIKGQVAEQKQAARASLEAELGSLAQALADRTLQLAKPRTLV